MTMLRSALIERLERYLPLTPGEKAAIIALGRRERRIAAGDCLHEEEGPVHGLYIVQHGWLHASTRLVSGERQILRFHYAGDLIGTASICWGQASNTLTAVSDCVVAEVTKAEIGALFVAEPRLAAMLYAMAAAENVAMSDRLASIGRTGARERLVTLLLDMLARLRVTAGGVVDAFDLPLTQSDLGDAVGLTKVHVNRTLRAMEADGVIERHGRRVRLVDPAGLARAVGFADRYREIETSWLPPAGA